MYYSVWRNNFIFQDWEEYEPEYQTLNLGNNCYVEVEKVGKNVGQICGLKSTNPNNYLNANLRPGKRIKYDFMIDEN